MKRILLASALALTASSAFADTYFRVGGSSVTSTVNAKADASIVEKSAATLKYDQSLSDSDFSTQAFSLGIGKEFNNYLAGELRYTIAGESTVDVYGEISAVDVISNADYYLEEPLKEQMTIEESNRFDALFLLKTPSVGIFNAYAIAGYSINKLTIGKADGDANGFTYGLGVTAKIDDSWSVNLEYQAFPKVNYSNSWSSSYSSEDETTEGVSDESTESDDNSTSTSSSIEGNIFGDYQSSSVNLNFTYKF